MTDIDSIDFFVSCPIKEFLNAGYHKYRPNWGWERQCNHASLYFIADGSLKFRLHGKEFAAKQNDVVFLRSSDRAVIFNESSSYSSLYFIAFSFDETVDLKINMCTSASGYQKMFKDILETYLSKAVLSNLKISHLFLKLIYNLSRDSLYSREDYIENSRIYETAEYININYYKDITIEQLCRISGYSAPHLRRLFIRNYGMSPQNYIINKRMEMAKEMLLEIPEKTVDEIADLIGICSASYFCKMFKQNEGMTPSEYKRKNMK